MCGYMAPGVVSSSDDLIEYYVADGSTVDPNAKKGYSERFIHGEMFKKFLSVNCVIHSHAEAVLPYVTSGIPLLPVFHMAGFLGESPQTCRPGVFWVRAVGSGEKCDAYGTARYILWPWLTDGQEMMCPCLT